MKIFFDNLRRHPVLLAVVGTLSCAILSTGLYFLLFGVSNEATELDKLTVAVLPSLFLVAVLLFSLGTQARDFENLKRDYENAVARDSLTSCLNSTLFSAVVDAHPTLTGSRSGRKQGSFLVIDVDRLSQLNKSAGHRAGDRALRAVGELIRGSVRGDDVVGRLGGGRFGVFLPGATLDNAGKVAERIRRAVSQTRFLTGSAEWPLSVTVGAAMFEQEVDYDSLVGAAEKILERAKGMGGNRVEYGQVTPDSSSPRPSIH